MDTDLLSVSKYYQKNHGYPATRLNEKSRLLTYMMGCILAEKFWRQPPFPGMDYMGHILQTLVFKQSTKISLI